MRPRDEGGSSLVGSTVLSPPSIEEDDSVVEGTMGVPDVLFEEVEKSLASPSSTMVVEEGVLVGSSVGISLGNVLVVAEGFPAWLGLLNPSRCRSISCWCPEVFHDCGIGLAEVDWLKSCDDL